MIITSKHLDILDDQQIIYLDAILKYKRYREIQTDYKVSRGELSHTMVSICKAWHLWPETPTSIRTAWNSSLRAKKAKAQGMN